MLWPARPDHALSSGEMQACLARLYVDAAFRRLLHVDPAFVVDAYHLRDDERHAILALEARELDLFADTLREKRRDKVTIVFPRMRRHAPAALDRCFDRFHDLAHPRLEDSADDEREAFGTFCHATLAADSDAPAWWSDLALYEATEHRSRLALRGVPRPDRALQTPGDARVARLTPEQRPRPVPGTQCATFRTPIVEVIRALNDGRDAPSQRGQFLYLMRSDEAFQITPRVADLFDGCDGQTTVDELTRGIAGALTALQSLLSARLIEVAC